MIELRGVRKAFGPTVAVDSVSLKATPGGVFGLIGPNGAGKTTTIRIIMNILEPDAGTVLFDGHAIREADKERIGYLPEERGLYKDVTVGDMLTYLARLKGCDARTARKRIDRWLERFELSEWKTRKIEQLSKGMSQKVQLISAVVHEPDMVFFDEPFSGLDPVSADQVRDIIIELGRENKTVLLSTHIMEHAERICSDIVLINKGRQVVSGPVGELKSHYGHRNLIIEFDGDGSVIDALGDVGIVSRYPRYVEFELSDGASPDRILSELVGRVSIQRFEVAAPSLHRIFVEQVGSQRGVEERGGNGE